MSRAQQAVQAGHAVAEWCAAEPHPPRWRNHTLLYLKVKNEKELLTWHRLRGGVLWREPDWQNQATALAVFGPKEDFEDLDLL